MASNSWTDDAEFVARHGLALLAAEARGDDLGLSILLSDLPPEAALPVIRFLTGFAVEVLAAESRDRGDASDRLGGVFANRIIASAEVA